MLLFQEHHLEQDRIIRVTKVVLIVYLCYPNNPTEAVIHYPQNNIQVRTYYCCRHIRVFPPNIVLQPPLDAGPATLALPRIPSTADIR